MTSQRYCQGGEVSTNMGSSSAMITSAKSIDRGDRFPAEIIEQAVWLYGRFPFSLRPVEDLLAARGIIVSHETATKPCGVGLRCSAGYTPARSVGARLSSATSGISTRSRSINGKKHWLWQCQMQIGLCPGREPIAVLE